MLRFNLALFILPPLILWMMVPAFVASTFPAIAKGGVIGIYLSISYIGFTELRKKRPVDQN